MNTPHTNTGHGHVWPRPDGVKARCGGPAICKECALDDAQMRGNPMPDMLKPSATLLIKLGSLIVHLEEAHSPTCHEFDIAAVKQLQADPEVIAWRSAMTKAAFLPLKR